MDDRTRMKRAAQRIERAMVDAPKSIDLYRLLSEAFKLLTWSDELLDVNEEQFKDIDGPTTPMNFIPKFAPEKTNDQRSLDDQLWECERYANTEKMYDAADFIRSALHSRNPSIERNEGVLTSCRDIVGDPTLVLVKDDIKLDIFDWLSQFLGGRIGLTVRFIGSATPESAPRRPEPELSSAAEERAIRLLSGTFEQISASSYGYWREDAERIVRALIKASFDEVLKHLSKDAAKKAP